MSSSNKNIIDALIAAFHDQREDILSESILQTSFVFEKYRGIGANLSAAQQAAILGWSPDVISTAINDEDIGRLKAAVISFISESPIKSHQGEAIWALSKLVDRTTKPVLVAALHAQLDNDQNAMYQAMIALANIGEDVFAGRGRLSSLDVAELRVLALSYLQRQGQL